MKKILITLIAVLSFSFANAQFKLGAAIGYETDGGTMAASGEAVYGLNETFELAADYSYGFEKDLVSLSTFDLNAHYLFNENFYALAGVNFAAVKVDLGPFGSVTANDTGANVGAGYRRGLSDSMDFFSEVKYMTALETVGIKVGILFNL